MDEVSIELNRDFSTKGLSSAQIQSGVAAWQAGAISRETMLDLSHRGEVLPEGRTNEAEVKLLAASPVVSTIRGSRRLGIRPWPNSGVAIIKDRPLHVLFKAYGEVSRW